MENTHENEQLYPLNDGQNQGHDWARHENAAEKSISMRADDPDDTQDEEEAELPEWGDIDPQHDPSRPAGPMDPSGPGSAV